MSVLWSVVRIVLAAAAVFGGWTYIWWDAHRMPWWLFTVVGWSASMAVVVVLVVWDGRS